MQSVTGMGTTTICAVCGGGGGAHRKQPLNMHRPGTYNPFDLILRQPQPQSFENLQRCQAAPSSNMRLWRRRQRATASSSVRQWRSCHVSCDETERQEGVHARRWRPHFDAQLLPVCLLLRRVGGGHIVVHVHKLGQEVLNDLRHGERMNDHEHARRSNGQATPRRPARHR